MTPTEMLFHAKYKAESLEFQFLEITKSKLAKELEYFEAPSDDPENLESLSNDIILMEEIMDHINSDLEFFTSFLETYGEQIANDLNPSTNSMN